jgi:hypothetical protein
LLVLACAGCAGRTLSPTAVKETSAALRGRGSCQASCSYYFRYGIRGQALSHRTPLRRTGATHGVVDLPAEPVTGLRPGTPYLYQLCGKPDSARAYTCVGPTGRPSSAQRLKTRLHWGAPPLSNPVVVRLNADGSNLGAALNLDQRRDYVFKLPSTPLRHRLVISGGHSVWLVGGEISILDQHDGCRYAGDPTCATFDASRHWGLVLKHQTGIAHVEGVSIDGPDLGVPILLDEDAGATVQLENIRATRIHAHDEANFTDQHPDCLITWAGPAYLRVENYTCTTDYFGFQFQPLAYNCGSSASPSGCISTLTYTYPKQFDLRYVNFYSEQNLPTTRWMAYKMRDGLAVPWWPIRLDHVYLFANPLDRRSASAGVCWAGDGASAVTDCATGWPGDVRVGSGRPPDGDFVTRARVGIGYRAAGY